MMDLKFHKFIRQYTFYWRQVFLTDFSSKEKEFLYHQVLILIFYESQQFFLLDFHGYILLHFGILIQAIFWNVQYFHFLGKNLNRLLYQYQFFLMFIHCNQISTISFCYQNYFRVRYLMVYFLIIFRCLLRQYCRISLRNHLLSFSHLPLCIKLIQKNLLKRVMLEFTLISKFILISRHLYYLLFLQQLFEFFFLYFFIFFCLNYLNFVRFWFHFVQSYIPIFYQSKQIFSPNSSLLFYCFCSQIPFSQDYNSFLSQIIQQINIAQLLICRVMSILFVELRIILQQFFRKSYFIEIVNVFVCNFLMRYISGKGINLFNNKEFNQILYFMGSIISGIWSKLFKSKNNFKILILGLANAGKTTILYQMNLGKVIQSQPTIGCNVQEVINKNVKFQVWDIGGQQRLRSSWPSFFADTDAVIFVIDSTDKKNDIISKGELFKLIIHQKFKKTIFLILANKQDVPQAMKEQQITSLYSLGQIKNHTWHIQGCSATQGKGLTEGLNWVTDELLKLHK